MDTERVKEAKEWLESQPAPDADTQMQRALSALNTRPKPLSWFSRYGKQSGLALGFAVTAGIAAFVNLQPRGAAEKPITTAQATKNLVPSSAPKRLANPQVAQKPVTNPATVLAKIPTDPAPNLPRSPATDPFAEPKGYLRSSSSNTFSPNEVGEGVAKPGEGHPSQNPLVLGGRGAKTDDLNDINGDPSAIQARWTQRPLDDEQQRVASVGAASDNTFIQVPVPQVAANGSPNAALEAWERQKQIVDTRLQKRVSIGEKGISFDDLCEMLTKETGVTFKCSRGVGDDKITLFCKARTLRDLMRQVNRIFGYVWDRLGDEPNFEYRLSQPVKNQLVEEELRNKDKNQNVVVWLSDKALTLRLDEAKVVSGVPLNFKVALPPNGGTGQVADVVVSSTFEIAGEVTEVQGKAAPLVVLNTTGKPTLTATSEGRVFSMSGFADGFGNADNAKNNAALKEFAPFQKKVSITPEPVLPKEKLCTTGDVLEAIFKSTGKDVMGDYFTLLLPQSRVTQKDVALFDALNNIGNAIHHRWDWEKATVSGESDWLQFRTAGYYNARLREVPNRLLERWKMARQTKKALDAMDLGEIALLTDPMLDSGNMAQGAQLLWGLSEWSTVTGHLRPHWRAFGKLTPERQQYALESEGIGFRQLKLDNQKELFSLISPEKRPSEFQLAGDLSAEDFWKATLSVRYPAPKDGPIFSYRMLGRAPQFWRWEVGPSMERTRAEAQPLARPGN